MLFSENKQVLPGKPHVFEIDSSETIRCYLQNETNFIRWFINGKQQEVNSTSGDRVRVGEKSELIVDKVQLSDGGTYECRGVKYAKYYTIYVNGKLNCFYLAKYLYLS